MLGLQPYEPGGLEATHLIVDAPIRPTGGGGQCIYALPAGTGPYQAEKILELGCPAHGRSRDVTYRTFYTIRSLLVDGAP